VIDDLGRARPVAGGTAPQAAAVPVTETDPGADHHESTQPASRSVTRSPRVNPEQWSAARLRKQRTNIGGIVSRERCP
jgi:hypothetical protein